MFNLKKFLCIASVCFIAVPLPVIAEEDTTTTTTTTTIPEGEVEEVETFDGTTTTTTTIPENTSTTSTTTTSTTTTTVPETWEQSTDMVIPEDELDIQGNEVQNNIDINNTWTGQYGCTDYCINLEFRQHGGEGADYEFDLPETTTIDEEELDIDIYEVGFTIGALNNESTVTYTHTDETTQTDTIEAQTFTSAESMYEVVVYNIRETLDTFIDKFTLTLNDWTLVDNISFKYIEPTTTTTTTTTLPPPPVVFEPPPPPEPEIFVVILDNGEEAELSQGEIDDGTLERMNQRQKNYELYGVELTDEQVARGDLKLYDIEEQDVEEIGDEFFDDVDVLDIVEDELTEEELELQMEFDEKLLELEEEMEIFEFDTEEEAKEFVETVLKVQEYIEEIDDIYIEEIIIEDIPEEIIIVIQEEELEDELDEEIFTDDTESETEIQEEDEIVIEEVELTEEEIQVEVKEVEEKIEAIQETEVEELETEQVVEIIEEVNDAGLENLDEVSEDVLEVVAQVVEQSIEKADELTVEQQEVVAEVLGFTETEDVQVIAEAVKTDETVAKAVEEYVERAVENADIEDYNLADVTTEITFESLAQGDFSVIIDVDLDAVNLTNITDDMSSQQKEKAQEVIVPTIMVRILSLAVRRFN